MIARSLELRVSVLRRIGCQPNSPRAARRDEIYRLAIVKGLPPPAHMEEVDFCYSLAVRPENLELAFRGENLEVRV